ncbi:MAG: hypothetical protein OGMRLDGQ_001651 [Candidatus Fervidibacter sp.]
MELKEAMQMAAWIFLGLTIAYAHFQMRKLRKIVFNDMLHRFTRPSSRVPRPTKATRGQRQ